MKNQKGIPEAKLQRTDFGLVPEGEGWYVVNVAESQWLKNEKFGERCRFEGDKKFEQYGIRIQILQPGQPNCHYHGEDNQENFLILKGTCRLLVGGQERMLREWDFVHCPPWTKHVFVGSGKGPCVILMVGGRAGEKVIYPIAEIAQKYNACPPKETDSPKESYADSPKWTETQSHWPLG